MKVLYLFVFAVVSAWGKPSLDGLVDLATESLLSVCDKNENALISKSELQVCFHKIKAMFLVDHLTAELFLTMFDVNTDGKISKKELGTSLSSIIANSGFKKAKTTSSSSEPEDASGMVDVTLRDGTVKSMSSKQLMDMAESRMQNMTQDEQGNYYKEESGNKSLADIAKTNPELASFIAIGRWALDEMAAALNCSDARIIGLRSLPQGGTANITHTGQLDSTRMTNNEIWMDLSYLYKGRKHRLEVHIARDLDAYVPPGIALLHAWELNSKGNRTAELTVPQPHRKRSAILTISELLVQSSYKSQLWLSLGVCVVILAVSLVYCSRSR